MTNTSLKLHDLTDQQHQASLRSNLRCPIHALTHTTPSDRMATCEINVPLYGHPADTGLRLVSSAHHRSDGGGNSISSS